MKLEFQASFDMSDVGLLDLFVEEDGGHSFNVTVSTGEWFLTEDGATADGDFAHLIEDVRPLLSEVETQLNAGAGAGVAYEVRWDSDARRVYLFADGSPSVTVTPDDGGALLGLTGPLEISGGAFGHRVPDYWIDSDVGFWSSWSGEYESDDDIAYDVEAHDGTPGGAAKEDAAVYLDFTVPAEPVAKVGVYPRLVEPAAPWTWRSFWRHCRNVQAFAMRDDDEVYYLLMRAGGATFRPKTVAANYIDRWDLAFETRVLARGV